MSRRLLDLHILNRLKSTLQKIRQKNCCASVISAKSCVRAPFMAQENLADLSKNGAKNNRLLKILRNVFLLQCIHSQSRKNHKFAFCRTAFMATVVRENYCIYTREITTCTGTQGKLLHVHKENYYKYTRKIFSF